MSADQHESPADALRRFSDGEKANPASEPVSVAGSAEIEIETGDGEVLAGVFTWDIPVTVNAKTAIGYVAASMRRGRAIADFDVDTLSLIEIVSYLTVAVKTAPEWMPRGSAGVVDWGEARDVVAFRLYEEVMRHEARFRFREAGRDAPVAPADGPD